MRGTPIEIGATRFWFRDETQHAATQFAREVLAACDAPERALKQGRRKALFAFSHRDVSYLVKVNRYPFGLRGWFRRSKARREATRAQAVAARGVDTPSFHVIGEERSATGRLRRCLAVVERLEGARDLASLRAEALPAWAIQKRWAHTLGALVRRMHRAGVLQDDLAPNNLLVIPAPTPNAAPRMIPIDFERALLVDQIDPRAAVRTLTKLHRYLYDSPSTLCWRFLLGYCGNDRGLAREVARQIQEETPRLFRRDLAHLLRVAGANNRRFRVLRGDAHDSPTPRFLSGWAHRAVSDLDLAGAITGERSERFWVTPLPRATRQSALAMWASAQALSQRAGLIAKPLALVETTGPPPLWILVSRRSPGEYHRAASSRERASAQEKRQFHMLVRRVAGLGLAAPQTGEALQSESQRGALLRVPPGSI